MSTDNRIGDDDLDDGVSYTPDYTDTERVDVGAALELKHVNTTALEVTNQEPTPDYAGMVLLRVIDDELRGKFLIEPEQAQWLSDELAEAADRALGE